MGNRIKDFFEQSWLLILASFGFGILLALTNYAWKPRIEQNKKDKFTAIAQTLLPDAKTFEQVGQVMLPNGQKITVRQGLKNGKTAGWAFVASGSGFADKIQLVIATDPAFKKIAGYGVLASNETPGYGDKINDSFFKLQFKGAPAEKLVLTKSAKPGQIDNKIVAITGATVTSDAMVTIFNKHLEPIKKYLQQEGKL